MAGRVAGQGCRGGHRREIQQDRSARLAAGIAFWAFFAVFPLLLVLVSLLGFFLPDSTRSEVMHNVAALFPLIDPDNAGWAHGSVWSIVAGTATALWSGTQLMRSAEFAFNSAWEIPAVERPGIAEQMKRALLALSTSGSGLS
jgi:Predicted membrane protein